MFHTFNLRKPNTSGEKLRSCARTSTVPRSFHTATTCTTVLGSQSRRSWMMYLDNFDGPLIARFISMTFNAISLYIAYLQLPVIIYTRYAENWVYALTAQNIKSKCMEQVTPLPVVWLYFVSYDFGAPKWIASLHQQSHERKNEIRPVLWDCINVLNFVLWQPLDDKAQRLILTGRIATWIQPTTSVECSPST